jgi:NADH-quinone oxidoreductase subunit J
MTGIIFYFLAFLILFSAILVVTRKNPVYSALWLVVTIISIAGVFIIAGAEFLAVVQVFVYAGGIMVLYVFLIMLLNLSKQELEKRQIHYHWWIVALVCFVLGLEICMLLIPSMTQPLTLVKTAHQFKDISNTTEVAKSLYSDFLLPFEVASILLVVAMIGAVLLGRKDPEPQLHHDNLGNAIHNENQGGDI